MAIKVRLKDATGNILHPETDWSVVQNRPSFNIGDSNGQRRETWDAPITSVVGTNTLYLASPQGGIMINDRTVGKDTPLADYPIKSPGVLKLKYIPLGNLKTDGDLINRTVRIEELEFGVGGYISGRQTCQWYWGVDRSNQHATPTMIVYYTSSTGTTTKLSDSDSVLVTYLDLPYTFEDMPQEYL